MDYRKYRKYWPCSIEESKQGGASIEKFSVSKVEARFFTMRHGGFMKPGDYTRLSINGKLIMSDTWQEYREHYDLFLNAEGHVLIHGLGLGCCLNVVSHIPTVEKITVIEINRDVIDLVSPHFQSPNIEIIHANALDWKSRPGQKFQAVWHDIWSDKCENNLKVMGKLHRRYGQKTDWQGSWSKKELQHRKRQTRNAWWRR